ncbi:hypothetical protein SDC9_189738 [bioreactor metagenome]|uniref:CBS domain-containing protein n=1 Tax=bioreactor metagenome TaxID=1076179 RepID=A0A645HUM8_9ZZZZ
MDFTNLMANKKLTIREVLKKLDLNAMGTVIVVDDNNKLLGTITDGDIRRALLRGMTIDDKITDIYNKDCFFFVQLQLVQNYI